MGLAGMRRARLRQMGADGGESLAVVDHGVVYGTATADTADPTKLYFDYTNVRLGIGGTPTHTLDAVRSAAGSAVTTAARNTSTAASSSAKLLAEVASGAAGDPSMTLSIAGVLDWTMAVNNAASDVLEIRRGVTPVLSFSASQMTAAYNIEANAASAGSVVYLVARNTSTAANSSAKLLLEVAGGAAGNPEVALNIAEVRTWYMRAVNADSDAFRLVCFNGVSEVVTFEVDVSGLVRIGSPTAGGAGTNFYVLDVARDQSGNTISSTIRNLSNSATSGARHLMEVAGPLAGNPFSCWSISGGQAYSAGIDNSTTGDPLVISAGATVPAAASALGLVINSSGNVGINGPTTAGFNFGVYTTAADLTVDFNTTSGSGGNFLQWTGGSSRIMRFGHYSLSSGSTAYGETKSGLAEFSTTNLSKTIFMTGASAPAALMLEASVGASVLPSLPTNTTRAYIPGILKTAQTDAGNITTGVDTLHTYSLPVTLKADGQSIEIETTIACAANGNNKQVILKFGSTTIADTGVLTQNGGYIVIRARVVRTGAATQRATSTIWAAAYIAPQYSTPAETLSGNVTILHTGEAVNTDDLVIKSTKITWVPAQN